MHDVNRSPESGPVTQHQAGAPETFAYDNAIVRNFIVATSIWGIVGFLTNIIGVVIYRLAVGPIMKP